MADERKILIVEDEKKIADTLRMGLMENGFYVEVAYDGKIGYQLLTSRNFDLVILDINLPGMNGYDLCKAIRYRNMNMLVIMLTSMCSLDDKVEGYDAGADDYLVKPFGLGELLARIRAALRRARPGGEVIRHGPLAVDIRTRKVSVAGEEIALTPKEFDILECLALDPGRVRSRQEILEAAWDSNWYGPTKVLDVHIAALRKKLGVAGLIETVYGCGFRLGDL
jgi:DNA-binding response OmpR family regulator